ncbi:MAG: TraE/TraK family type IV conjugative transfer system protein [Candidatus Competibacteraceae bacterium]
MSVQAFLTTWQGLQAENRWSRLIILVLAVANLIGWLAAVQEDSVVVLVPPELNQPIKVARQQADADFKRTWGLFVATLLGNVTPGNADLIVPGLEPLLAPSIAPKVKLAIAEQLSALRQEEVSLSFSSKAAIYEVSSGKTFITGTLQTTGLSGAPQRSERTYEMEFQVVNYRPQLTFIDAYTGPPRQPNERVKPNEPNSK